MLSVAPNRADTAVGFSVIVPSYNQARFIRATLDSLLDQEYPNLEIIVVDGGSTDGTLDVLREYGDRIRWLSEKDNGQSDAIVKGFKLARHEWLTWLNSDDVQTNNALHCVSDAIRRTPSAQVVVGNGHYTDQAGTYLRPYPTINVQPGADVRKELFTKGYLAQPSVYFRRDAYEAIGGIDPTLQFVMDYDLWVRLAQAGCVFVGVPQDISGNRWHESAKTASQLLPLLAEAAEIQKRAYGHVSAYFVQAISDHLYSVLHSPHRGDQSHLLYRTLYFKAVWLWLNLRDPWYCIKGLIAEPICMSGPIVGDRLTFAEIVRRATPIIRRRLQQRRRKALP